MHRPSSAPAAYQPSEPYHRNRGDKERWRNIQRENDRLQRKLKEIKTHPSCLAANNQLPCTEIVQQDTGNELACGALHAPAPVKWPSPPKTKGEVLRCRKDREIDRNNKKLAKKLAQRCGPRHDSFMVKSGLGKGINCTAVWQLRTGLYTGDTSQAAHSMAPDRHGLAANSQSPGQGVGRQPSRPKSSQGVPKSLGMACCSGCGKKSFYNADGVCLTPCRQCQQVYYCSELCARLDYPSHKHICKYATTGHWTPAGTRPAGEYWVQNPSWAVARKLLRTRPATAGPAAALTGYHQHGSTASESLLRSQPGNTEFKGYGSGLSADQQSEALHNLQTADGGTRKQGQSDTTFLAELDRQSQLEQQLKAVNLADKVKAEAQRVIEERAMNGMDGPRPCLCMNGRPLSAGSAGSSRVQSGQPTRQWTGKPGSGDCLTFDAMALIPQHKLDSLRRSSQLLQC
eukprot:jgi/Chrzof1/9097/Cz03g35280.t1